MQSGTPDSQGKAEYERAAGETEGGKEQHAGVFVYFDLQGFGLRNSSLSLNAYLFPMGLYLGIDILTE